MDRSKVENRKKAVIYRHLVQKGMRDYLLANGFIEIIPPYLIPSNAPDPFIDPLWVNSIAQNQSFQLHTSPELALKKTLGYGFNRLFSLVKVFRDDPPSEQHGLEFSMLEWYRAHEDLDSLLLDCKELIKLSKEAYSKAYDKSPAKEEINIQKKSVSELFYEASGLDLVKIQKQIASGDDKALQSALIKSNEILRPWATFQDAFFHIWIKYIEPKLPKEHPIAIVRWPIQLAALSMPCQDDPNFCDRFEIYFQGLEIANAYLECNDAEVIRSRFIKENTERELLGKPVFLIDEEFLKTLEFLPKISGIALGFERLLMAAGNFGNIREVLG